MGQNPSRNSKICIGTKWWHRVAGKYFTVQRKIALGWSSCRSLKCWRKWLIVLNVRLKYALLVNLNGMKAKSVLKIIMIREEWLFGIKLGLHRVKLTVALNAKQFLRKMEGAPI